MQWPCKSFNPGDPSSLDTPPHDIFMVPPREPQSNDPAGEVCLNPPREPENNDPAGEVCLTQPESKPAEAPPTVDSECKPQALWIYQSDLFAYISQDIVLH